MAHVTYRVVAHDGGWAYRLEGTFSEPFPTRAQAVRAAHRAAAEQRVPGDTAVIQYEDAQGTWRTEVSESGDRPEADVID